MQDTPVLVRHRINQKIMATDCTATGFEPRHCKRYGTRIPQIIKLPCIHWCFENLRTQYCKNQPEYSCQFSNHKYNTSSELKQAMSHRANQTAQFHYLFGRWHSTEDGRNCDSVKQCKLFSGHFHFLIFWHEPEAILQLRPFQRKKTDTHGRAKVGGLQWLASD